MNFANVKTLAIPEGNVKQIEDAQGNVLWEKFTPISGLFYLTNEDTSPVTVSILMFSEGAPTLTLQTSDDGTTWTTIGTTSTTALDIVIPVGGYKYLRSSSAIPWGANYKYNHFTSNGNFGAHGNIMGLIGYNTLRGTDCAYMFYNCTGLTTVPELPATTLASSCYTYMFRGCSQLTKAPYLPATTLVQNCYQGMFNGCSALNEIKCNATNLGGSANLINWVNGVAASGTFYKNASMSSWPTGNGGIPSGWTVVNI